MVMAIMFIYDLADYELFRAQLLLPRTMNYAE
jgi:hypothetical protein